MLNSLLTNRYLLRLIKDYVQFQYDNNTHFAASDGIKPSYTVSGDINQPTDPILIFTDNSPKPENNTYIFKELITEDNEYEDFVKSVAITDHHTLGLFSCNSNERLYGIYTGSTTSNHSNYYLPIYNKIPSSVDAYHEFDISYAHISGSGSSYVEIDGDYETEYLPSKTMYRKYMLECFEKTDGKFHFKNDKNGEHFYILQFGRDSFKDRLDPGNFQISLAAYPPFLRESEIEIPLEQFLTASKIFTLIDNSRDGNEYISETEEVKDYYYLVSGSLQDGIYDEPESDGWGLIFPNKGIVILDATVLDNSCSLETTVSSINGNNPYKLFLSISSSLTPLSTLDNTKTKFNDIITSTTDDNTFGIKTDGTLWAWGLNDNGELGIGNINRQSSPVQVGTLSNWSNITTNYNVSIAVKTDGTLWGWGNNQFYQLGIGNTTINRSSPVQIGTETNWKKAYIGGRTTFAFKTDETLWAWGVNSGRFGDNSLTFSNVPKQISNAYDWKDISPTSQNSLGIKYDGTIWAWGNGFRGEHGLNDSNVSRSSPVQIGTETNWTKVYGQTFSVGGIKTDGTIWAWGSNFQGELGLGDTINRSSPVQVGTLSNWKDVYSSDGSKIAVKTDGTIWGWGGNSFGQLGFSGNKSSPVQIGTLSNWKNITLGSEHTIAITNNDLIYTAGSNRYGQIIKTKSPSNVLSLMYDVYERTNTGSFFARSMEKKIVETYFCRVMPGEMMYSNNPTYLSGSAENVKYRYFQKHGGTYITTIGLYNNNKELLAIGKLKKPLFRKNNVETRFQVRVRLN